MSAINLSTLAQNLNIQTVEQLHIYTGLLMHRLYPTKQMKESESQTVFACTFNTFQINDGSTNVIIRTSVPIDAAFTSDRSKKLWMFAKELGDLAVPATFLAN